MKPLKLELEGGGRGLFMQLEGKMGSGLLMELEEEGREGIYETEKRKGGGYLWS